MISEGDLGLLASEFELSKASIKAVLDVESSGKGFAPDTGKILIRFEPYQFFKKNGNNVEDSHASQAEEWLAFERAYTISGTDAMLETSWGIGQIMGKHYDLAGYNHVVEMVDDFKLGETQQTRGMLNFIRNGYGMLDALRKNNFQEFAKLYNGRLYARNNYDKKLLNAYNKHKANG